MAGSHFFRMGKVKGKNGILNAAKHNKRALQAERGGAGANIDAFRTPLNYSLTDPTTAEQVDRTAKVQMVQTGIDKPRANQVMALEIVFSLPANWHEQDTQPFFQDCMTWTRNNMPGVLLSFDVHLDESAPHAHALILPLVNGRMKGNEIMGGMGKLMYWINLFYSEVAINYGFNRNQNRYLAGKQKEAIDKQVLSRLIADPIMKSTVWPCVRDAIRKDPLPYAQILGIEYQQKTDKKRKSFTQIMTSKGKGKSINTI